MFYPTPENPLELVTTRKLLTGILVNPASRENVVFAPADPEITILLVLTSNVKDSDPLTTK